ncbi:MAG: GNAT family N-acetyltransferase [Coriobacteriia bacterium]|nr:GNAT family N-acetyltransferase [Coriobacteriia bacterium]
MNRQRYDIKAVGAAIATLVVWSSAFAGISVVVGPGGGYGAGQVALLRFLVASATMVVLSLVTRQRMLPDLKDVPHLFVTAIFGITIYHLGFTFGETQVSAGAAALIIASGPIWTALLAIAFLGERLNIWGWGGVLLAFSGVAAISLGEGGGGFTVEPMALLVLLASMSTAVYFVMSKRPLRKYSSLEFTSYVIWLGTIPMLVFLPGLLTQLPAAPASSTWIIVFLGVFPGAVAYWLWSYALARMPASVTASFLYAQPAIATFVAWVWQRTLPGPVTLAGGALALCGVILVQTKGRPPAAGPVVAVATSAEQRAAVRELTEETIERFSADFGLDHTYYDEELANFDAWYGGERGRSLLATIGGVPAGSVVFREFGDGAAELRRLYVRPAFRRRGVARALLSAAEAEARALGYARLQFMTTPEFEGAIELYESEGYAPTDLYRDPASEKVVAYARTL